MKKYLCKAWIISLLLVFSGCTNSTYTLTVPNYGQVGIETPKEWSFESTTTSAQGANFQEIIFKKDPDFQMLITFIPDKTEEVLSMDRLKKVLDETSQDLLASTVETEYTTHELAGAEVQGYYTDPLTDKSYDGLASKEGQYKYIVTVSIKLDELFIVASIVSNEKESPDMEKALQILKDIKSL